jgi:N,N'-diacetyllegionaminate synthase
MKCIAEIGSNHNSSLDLALKHVVSASIADADVVKFQLINNFKPEWIGPLIKMCQKVNIRFLASVFNASSLQYVTSSWYGVKIASPESTNRELIREAEWTTNRLGIKLFISTGAIDGLDEIPCESPEFIPFVCVSKYPAEVSDYLLPINDDELGIPWGLSDHTIDPVILPVAATALGATYIEKHFTLDKEMGTDDARFSLNPEEFKRMVSAVRQASNTRRGNKITIRESRIIKWPL